MKDHSCPVEDAYNALSDLPNQLTQFTTSFQGIVDLYFSKCEEEL